ncbi:pupal cuticle protein-like [Maniola jurtina]|uniref:pupal cuticle protein-like n=1 Tax=Maniola jurtina TaxID=191418 RepID=UPI001E68B05F|nr:pupal cuticle protein-like [Maniola jurtina]
MRSMIVACLALACGAHAGWVGPPANIALSQDGRNILDTPEVAQARAAQLAALQKASLNNPNPNDDGSYNPAWNNEEYWQRADKSSNWNGAPANQWNAGNQWNGAPAAQAWNGAPAAPAWNAAGHAPAPVAETPEVAQARAAHLAALNSANSAPAHNQWNAGNNGQWNAANDNGQWNSGNDNGQWNAANDNGQWNAANDNGQWNAGNDDGQWRSGNEGQWNGNHQNQQWNGNNQQNQWNGAPSWQGPPAQIRLAHNGAGILDTPEVAAARAAHLAAHAKIGAPAHPQQHW